uniref:Uncharacterized protein n=1 Tax=Nelumbo nucifera TaxID=4432 RepID=A0A822YJX6_NELNU|nr:TPA_asm: hypothetical protein HUJ06_011653 [Nelumbo nucifera]
MGLIEAWFWELSFLHDFRPTTTRSIKNIAKKDEDARKMVIHRVVVADARGGGKHVCRRFLIHPSAMEFSVFEP